MKKKLIVFNLSGALLMPVDEVISVWCKAIRSTGLLPDYELIYDNFGADFETYLIPKMTEKKKWEEIQVDTIVSNAKKVFKDINTSTNAQLAKKLRSLKARGYTLGVVSNKTIDKLMGGLLKIGCSHDVFDFVKTGEDGIKKPDPRVFDKMTLKFAPKDIIFVGDNPHYDLPLAVNAGVDFVAICSACFPTHAWKVDVNYYKVSGMFGSVPDYIDSLI